MMIMGVVHEGPATPNISQFESHTTEVILERANLDHASVMLPVTIFMSVIMIAGAVGNSVVCIVYMLKRKKPSYQIFVLTLAIVDLFCCLVTHPYLISKFFRFYNPDVITCKIFEFIIRGCTETQVILLACIAVDRYYSVYRPFEYGNSGRRVKISVGISFVAGFGGAAPVLKFYGWHKEGTSGAYRVTLYYCHYQDAMVGTLDHLVFQAAEVTALTVCVLLILVMYTMVARKVVVARKQIGSANASHPVRMTHKSPASSTTSRKNKVPSIEVREATSTSAEDNNRLKETSFYNDKAPFPQSSHAPNNVQRRRITSNKSKAYCPGNVINMRAISNIGEGSNSTPKTHFQMILKNRPTTQAALLSNLKSPDRLHVPVPRMRRTSPLNSTSAGLSRPGLKVTKTLVLVTGVLFLVWVPFWVVCIGSIVNPEKWQPDDTTLMMVYRLLIHLIYVNNAINPFLYTFTCSSFRQDCKKTWRQIRTNFCS